MSSAFYPLGMNSMPSSGYSHKSSYYNKQYITWKGTGQNSFPIGSAPGHIRPLTNNDSGNIFETGFGLPRPIKHYRKGRVITSQPSEVNNNENSLINYNLNRFVKSSKGSSLGGGFGGSGLLNEMQDKPGGYVVKLNNPNDSNVGQLNNCEGIKIVSSYKPNNFNLLENPEPNTTNPILCCNQEKKARQRTVYASTNLKKNYYTTTKQYLQNRCKTYDQKAFNFLSYKTNGYNETNNPYYYSVDGNNEPKPGGPLALSNTYLANCQLNTQLYEGTELAIIYKIFDIMLNEQIITNTEFQQFESTNINSIQGLFNWIQELPEEQRKSANVVFEVFINNPYFGMPLSGPTNPAGCQLTVYKPNNYQFAKQGAVSSSTRNLKLNVDTITTNASSITANQLSIGDDITNSNLLKNKAPNCNTQLPLNFSQSRQFKNKKFCHFPKQLPEYQIPLSQPSSYRYYPGTVFRSNYYSQSPNTYNTTTGANAY
jgi:hypothetical protein